MLENHHAATGFALMERTNLLNGSAFRCASRERELKSLRSLFYSRLTHALTVPAEMRKALRKITINAIIATDMAVHKSLLARVAERVAERSATAVAGQAPAKEGDFSPNGSLHGGSASTNLAFLGAAAEERALFVSFLLHVAGACFVGEGGAVDSQPTPYVSSHTLCVPFPRPSQPAVPPQSVAAHRHRPVGGVREAGGEGARARPAGARRRRNVPRPRPALTR